MSAVKFSIVITSFNQRAFIKDAVDSALSFLRPAWEVIAVDDGSTDGTQDLLRAYGDRIRLVCLPTNQGTGAARNCGAGMAGGEYLAFLDGDDAFLPWTPNVYERIVQAKKPKMILGAMKRFEGSLPPSQGEDLPREIRIVEYQDFLRRDRAFRNSASALVIDRPSFESVKGWSTDIWPANDQDIGLRLGDCGRAIHVLDPPTAWYRQHAGNTVKQIPLYIPSFYKIIHKEQRGEYPGGKRRSFERRALIGVILLHWTRRGGKACLNWPSMKLLARAWPMLLAALIRRLGLVFKSRLAVEKIEL